MQHWHVPAAEHTGCPSTHVEQGIGTHAPPVDEADDPELLEPLEALEPLDPFEPDDPLELLPLFAMAHAPLLHVSPALQAVPLQQASLEPPQLVVPS